MSFQATRTGSVEHILSLAGCQEIIAVFYTLGVAGQINQRTNRIAASQIESSSRVTLVKTDIVYSVVNGECRDAGNGVRGRADSELLDYPLRNTHTGVGGLANADITLILHQIVDITFRRGDLQGTLAINDELLGLIVWPG